jgi:hypothetical protein
MSSFSRANNDRFGFGQISAFVWRKLQSFAVTSAHCDIYDIAMRLRNVAMLLNPSPCLIPMAHDMMI